MSKFDELKPCPFCGGESEITEHGYTSLMDIGCDTEGCAGQRAVFYSLHDPKWKEKSIGAWNTRTDERAEMQAAIRELREALEGYHHNIDVPEGEIYIAELASSALYNTKKWDAL